MLQSSFPSFNADLRKFISRWKRPSANTCMAMAVLTFFVSASAGSTVAQEITLQRLFTTPEQRAAIDTSILNASNQSDVVNLGAMLPLANAEMQVSPDEPPLIPENYSIFYHGSFGSSDTQIVWINGTLVDLQTFTDVLQMNPKSRELLVYLGPQRDWVPLKAGQMLYLQRQVVTDRMQEDMDAYTPVDTSHTSRELPQLQQPEFISLLRSQSQ